MCSAACITQFGPYRVHDNIVCMPVCSHLACELVPMTVRCYKLCNAMPASRLAHDKAYSLAFVTVMAEEGLEWMLHL